MDQTATVEGDEVISKQAAGHNDRSVRFGKKLAHTDKKVREKGFKIVLKWLKKNAETLDAMEMMKMWKSLWYAFWMSDKPLVQQELAVNLALTMNAMPEDKWPLWIAAFWETMQSSWEKIDRHRMNKYLLLMRCFLAETLHFVRIRKWSHELIEEMNEMLTDVSPLCLNVTEGNGVAMHYASIFVAEFEIHHAQSPATSSTAMLLLEPFLKIVVEGKQHAVVQQVHDKVLRKAPKLVHTELIERITELGNEDKFKDRRKNLHDTVLFLRGEKKDEPHPLIGRRSRPEGDEKWERKKRKTE